MKFDIYTSGEVIDVAQIFTEERYYGRPPEAIEFEGHTLALRKVHSSELGEIDWDFRYMPPSMLSGNISNKVRENIEGKITRAGLWVTTLDKDGNVIYDELKQIRDKQLERLRGYGI